MKPTQDMFDRAEQATCGANECHCDAESMLAAALESYELAPFELEPAEQLALKVASGIAERGEPVGANTSTVLIWALDRAQRTLVHKSAAPAELTHDDVATVYGAACADRANGYGDGLMPATTKALRELIAPLKAQLADSCSWADHVEPVERRLSAAVDLNHKLYADVRRLEAQLTQPADSGAEVTDAEVLTVFRAAHHDRHHAGCPDTRTALEAFLAARRGAQQAPEQQPAPQGEWTAVDYDIAADEIAELADPDGEGPSFGQLARAALDAVAYRLTAPAAVGPLSEEDRYMVEHARRHGGADYANWVALVDKLAPATAHVAKPARSAEQLWQAYLKEENEVYEQDIVRELYELAKGVGHAKKA